MYKNAEQGQPVPRPSLELEISRAEVRIARVYDYAKMQ
jgi:hypothetical protein